MLETKRFMFEILQKTQILLTGMHCDKCLCAVYKKVTIKHALLYQSKE